MTVIRVGFPLFTTIVNFICYVHEVANFLDFDFVALFEGFYNELLRLMSIGVG